jgi:hypothetical protein
MIEEYQETIDKEYNVYCKKCREGWPETVDQKLKDELSLIYDQDFKIFIT